MSETNTFARSLHDLGLAAWFGGSLMGAIGLNGAAAQVSDPSERARIATQGWKRWAPVNATAITSHVVGGALIVKANKARIAGQAGVGTLTVAKTALTVAALAATAGSGYYGRQMDQAGNNTYAAGATEPSSQTPPAVAKAQKSLRPLQWAIPALTAAVLVINARMGEQQRPSEVTSGLLSRILPS
ncbi:MAG TPA: hypothetical protein VG184_08230 [Acidimicrobiales bacterium]|jgi:hypothetical protein|nr:hypothetical protein [Acidimicrobiales bacterium]